MRSSTTKAGEATGDVPAYSARIREVLAHIEAHYRGPIPMQRLADIAQVGVVRLITRFRQEVGVSPHRYVCDMRVREAQNMLRSGMLPAAAALEAGFYDQSHLARHFKRVCGSTPGKYRGKYRGENRPGPAALVRRSA